MDVTITVGSVIRVESPYDPDFVSKARSLGGKFERPYWVFDPRSEQAVRKACIAVYGSDGSDNDQPRLTVRIPLDGVNGNEWRPAGEALVRRRGRDERVQYAEGVVLHAGGFPGSGGSVKNPRLEPKPGTVIEVRDLAPGTARKILAEDREATLVEDNPAPAAAERRATLEQERDRLRVRIAEIEQILAELDALGSEAPA